VDFILDGQPEPPLYFARMKRWNKIGPPLLAAERTPRRLSIDAFKKAIHEKSTTIVDTRPISDFMKGHVPGSFSVLFDNGFNTVAGSYLAEDASVLLIINETDVDAARRDLERVGIDGFHSFVTPEDLEAYVAQGGKMVATPSITFNDLDRFNGESVILDVRKKVEYDQKHLEGAINAVHVRLPELLDKIPSDRKLLVHCQSGKRASYAVSYLESRGYDVVYINDTFL
jgi:hydroxyacylglutathione hydrolase